MTASAGNMAQGVAWCARRLGIPCTVIAPATAPDAKINAIERLGGRVVKVSFDEWWRAFEQRSFPGVEGTFIHAFDDRGCDGWQRHDCLWRFWKIFRMLMRSMIPWGGGGLTCGIASALRSLRPSCKIFTAEVVDRRAARRFDGGRSSNRRSIINRHGSTASAPVPSSHKCSNARAL